MADSAVKSITVYPLSIPLRRRVSHAASRRTVADPIVVSVELNSNVIGYGETLPRAYVTGETVDSVMESIGNLFAGLLLDFHPPSFPEALEAIEALPACDRTGAPIPAARAAVELALLDAYSRHFCRPMTDVVGWMGFSEFGSPGSLPTVRYSAVLAADQDQSTRRLLRLYWWYGLRDFKLKVGGSGDANRVPLAWRYLARSIAARRATLRLDANGAWTLAQAIDRLTEWQHMDFAAVEQPLAPGDERDLADLRACVHAPLMYDESLVSLEDAQRLVDLQVADAFNIRISKCGGLLPALRLAYFARKHGIWVQLGCMVGETAILSAAGRKFLEMVPQVRFAEGSFGRFLLGDDVALRTVQFGYGGRVKPLGDLGWGINVDPERLVRLTIDHPIRHKL